MEPPGTLVSLRWSGPPGQRVELVGDFPDWSYPVPMEEGSPGQYSCQISLEPGVYRYKFRVNGRLWVHDALARLVDRTDVFQNALLVVGGTAPPLVFAPDRRHLAVFEDGRAVFHLETCGPEADPGYVFVLPDPSDPRRRVFAPLHLVGRRGDWRLFDAEADLGEKWPRTAVFGFSASPQTTWPLPRSRGPLGRPPPWAGGMVFYSILLDRWLRGTESPPHPRARSRRAPSTASTFYGGDLDGVRESLGYLAGLGVGGLLLSSLHPSPGPLRSESTDLLSVDPTLGGTEALARLIDAAHRRGMRVVVAAAPTYVHRAHPAFRDLLLHQQRSRFAGFFRVRRFPVVEADLSTFEAFADRPELPKLDLAAGSPARRYVLKAVQKLVAAGVDGLRLDALDDAPADFWRELRARARARNPDLLLLGDGAGGCPARYAEERGVDLAVDSGHREAMLAFFARGSQSAEQFWERTVFDRFRCGPLDRGFHLLCLDTDNTPRFLSLAVLFDRLRLALTYLLLRPEPVALTYGTEVGLAGSDPGQVLGDAWLERLPMPPPGQAPPSPTLRVLRELTRLRAEHLRGASAPRLVRAQGRLLVLERHLPDRSLRVFLNAGDEAAAVADLPERAQLLLAVNNPTASPRSLLPGCAARVYLLPH